MVSRRYKVWLAGLLVATLILAWLLAAEKSFTAQSSTTPTPTPTPSPSDLAWKSLYGPQERAAFGLALFPGKKRSRIFASTWGQGVYRATVNHDEDSYGPWNSFSTGLPRYIRPLAVLRSSETDVYAGSAGQSLYRTVNSGLSWTQLDRLGKIDPVRNSLYVESVLVISEPVRTQFQAKDIKDVARLASRLQRGSDTASQYLVERFSPPAQAMLDEYDADAGPSPELTATLLAELNRLLQEEGLADILLFNPTFFADNFYRELANTERIVVGTHGGVWVSDDWGDHWDQLSTGFRDSDAANEVQALAQGPGDWLWAGTRDGLYGSTDGGKNWEHFPAPQEYRDQAHLILSLAVVTNSVDGPGIVLVGTDDDGGLFAVDVETRSWSGPAPDFGPEEGARTIQALLAVPDGPVFAGTVDFGAYRSDDGARTWQQMAEGLPSHARSILSFAYDRTDDSVYAGTYGDGVYRLHPESTEWQQLNEGFPAAFPVQTLAFAGSQGERLLAGLQVGGLYASTDWQEPEPSWTRLPDALPVGRERDLIDLVVSEPDGAKVLIASREGVFSSTNEGETSIPLTTTVGLPDQAVPLKSVAADKKTGKAIYVALSDEKGIYRSLDGGTSWEPAEGNLGEELRKNACCLAVGVNQETVYLGLVAEPGQVYTQPVWISTDGGQDWNPLSPVDSEDTGNLKEIAWSGRTDWDRLVFGGHQEMLFARTTTGIYVSYDGGTSWPQKLVGSFTDLVIDPDNPWVVYAASDEDPAQLWASQDGGQTWSQVGPGPVADDGDGSAITVLALKPGLDLIFAGTETLGVYSAEVRPAQRWPTFAFAAAILCLLLLAAGAITIVYTGTRLARPWRPKPWRWPELVVARTLYRLQFDLVSEEHSRLPALECLALGCQSGNEFRASTTWQGLLAEGVPVGFAQTRKALDSLVARGLLLQVNDGYRLRNPWLGRIAREHFWEYRPERERLTELLCWDVHDEHLDRAGRFFERAGIPLVSSLETGFTVRQRLGDEVYVHVHTLGCIDGAQEEIEAASRNVYREQTSTRNVFLVVDVPPQRDACSWMLDLEQREAIIPYLIPYDQLHGLADADACRRRLDRILWRARGNRDLFWLDGPADSRLDFFGQEKLLQELVIRCESGEVVALDGMARVGKTSLVHHVLAHMSDPVVATMDMATVSGPGLYLRIRRAWQAQIEQRDPRLHLPGTSHDLEQPGEQQITADLQAILARLPASMRLQIVLDGLVELGDRSEMGCLVRAINWVPRAGCLAVFNATPHHPQPFPVFPVRPLVPADVALMVHSLAGRMALEIDDEALQLLQEASGGHPLILRELASLSVVKRRRLDRRVIAQDVQAAEDEYLGQSKLPLGQSKSALVDLWTSLAPEEQQAIRDVSAGRAPGSGNVERLQELGWLQATNGRQTCFSHTLKRWLEA